MRTGPGCHPGLRVRLVLRERTVRTGRTARTAADHSLQLPLDFVPGQPLGMGGDRRPHPGRVDVLRRDRTRNERRGSD